MTAIANQFSNPKGYKSRQGRVFASFVDFKKAYDSVQHHLLWERLAEHGVSKKLMNMLQKLYSNIFCRVKVNGFLSEEFRYKMGVRQGCIISPLLFNLFLDGITKILLSENIGVNIGDVVLLLYADDIILIAENEEDLQLLVKKLKVFCNESKMSVNIKKTKWMVFEQRPCQAYLNFSLFFDDEVIERVSQYKYLGTVFNANMNFSAHIDYILIKAEKSAFMFWKYTERFTINI